MPQQPTPGALTSAIEQARIADARARVSAARAVTQRVIALQISQAMDAYGPALVLDAAADACIERAVTASGSDRHRTAADLTVIGDVLRDAAARLLTPS